MGFFYISAPFLEKSKEATHREINDVVLKKSIADGKEVPLERQKFKQANLDTLMLINDKLLKLQNVIEAFLKKIDRQFLDLQDKQSHDWYIKSGDREMSITKFLYEFRWNDSKYPRSYPLPRITEILEAKVNNSESQLRSRTNAYNQTKANLSQATHKEGNYFVRDLTDILVEPHVSQQDFIYTKFVTTVVVIVPQISVKDFLQSYEWMTENVIPYSAKQLKVPEKDGLTIWKVNLFNEKIQSEKDEEEEQDKKKKRNLTVVQEFSEKAREKLKIVVKEFKYEAGLSDQRKKKKKELETKLSGQNKAISDICLAYFAEIYELYIHAKVLRLIIETNMRFGSDPTVIYLIETQAGKEKNVQGLLVEIFGDKESEGLYGTKDEIDDGEDFFPFIYVPALTL